MAYLLNYLSLTHFVFCVELEIINKKYVKNEQLYFVYLESGMLLNEFAQGARKK